MKKLTKKQRAALDLQHEKELDAWFTFRAQRHGIEQLAFLRWFDASSGEGMVTLVDGTSLYIHYTAIEGADKNNYAYPSDRDRERFELLGYNTVVKVVPYISAGYHGIETLKFI